MARSLSCILYSSLPDAKRSRIFLRPGGRKDWIPECNAHLRTCHRPRFARLDAPRNDDGRSAKAALRDWQDTIAAPRLCNRRQSLSQWRSRRSSPLASSRSSPTCASRAADPHSVAGADRRPRHRPLRLCAGAAGHARRAGLVVFRRGLHEHRSTRPVILPAPWSHRSIIKRFGLSATVRWGTLACVASLALCAISGNFVVLSFARLLAGLAAAAVFRRRRSAGGDDRAIAAGAGELSAESVLRRARVRHPVVRPDRAVRAAGVRPGIVVDRLVGDDAAHDRHDHPAAADAARCERRHRRCDRRPKFADPAGG